MLFGLLHCSNDVLLCLVLKIVVNNSGRKFDFICFNTLSLQTKQVQAVFSFSSSILIIVFVWKKKAHTVQTCGLKARSIFTDEHYRRSSTHNTFSTFIKKKSYERFANNLWDWRNSVIKFAWQWFSLNFLILCKKDSFFQYIKTSKWTVAVFKRTLLYYFHAVEGSVQENLHCACMRVVQNYIIILAQFSTQGSNG